MNLKEDLRAFILTLPPLGMIPYAKERVSGFRSLVKNGIIQEVYAYRAGWPCKRHKLSRLGRLVQNLLKENEEMAEMLDVDRPIW